MNFIKIKAQDQNGIIWEGEGTSCSMTNSLGNFDILAEHTQFITPITGDIIVRNDIQITWQHHLESNALCRVKANQVEIWVGI